MTQPPTSTAPSYGDEVTDWLRAVIEAEAADQPMPRHPYADRQHPGMNGAMMARQLSEPARAVVDELDRVAELGSAAAVLYGQSLGDVLDRTLASARYRITELDERLDQADRFAVAAQEDTARLQRIAVDLCRERDRHRKGIEDIRAAFDEVRTERAFLRLYSAELVDAGIDPADIDPADVDRALARAKAAVAHNPAGVVDPPTVARAFHDAYERLAASFGYEVRADVGQRPYDELPDNNRRLMEATAATVLLQLFPDRMGIPHDPPPDVRSMVEHESTGTPPASPPGPRQAPVPHDHRPVA